jgi:hypothetical protein
MIACIGCTRATRRSSSEIEKLVTAITDAANCFEAN